MGYDNEMGYDNWQNLRTLTLQGKRGYKLGLGRSLQEPDQPFFVN